MREIKEKKLLGKAAQEKTSKLLKNEMKSYFNKVAKNIAIGVGLALIPWVGLLYGAYTNNSHIAYFSSLSIIITTVIPQILSDKIDNLRRAFNDTYFNPTYSSVKQELKLEQKEQRKIYDAQKSSQASPELAKRTSAFAKMPRAKAM